MLAVFVSLSMVLRYEGTIGEIDIIPILFIGAVPLMIVMPLYVVRIYIKKRQRHFAEE